MHVPRFSVIFPFKCSQLDSAEQLTVGANYYCAQNGVKTANQICRLIDRLWLSVYRGGFSNVLCRIFHGVQSSYRSRNIVCIIVCWVTLGSLAKLHMFFSWDTPRTYLFIFNNNYTL